MDTHAVRVSETPHTLFSDGHMGKKKKKENSATPHAYEQKKGAVCLQDITEISGGEMGDLFDLSQQGLMGFGVQGSSRKNFSQKHFPISIRSRCRPVFVAGKRQEKEEKKQRASWVILSGGKGGRWVCASLNLCSEFWA